MAAPRKCVSWCITLKALAGVSSKSFKLGRLPSTNCLASSRIIPPAISEAIVTKRANLDTLPVGTERPLDGNLSGGKTWLVR
jgi:hypothetical protein